MTVFQTAKARLNGVLITCTTCIIMTSPKKCVVLVTGGSGFLGQHVIGLLQTRAPYVTEIRVIDLPSNPYTDKLGKLYLYKLCYVI